MARTRAASTAWRRILPRQRLRLLAHTTAEARTLEALGRSVAQRSRSSSATSPSPTQRRACCTASARCRRDPHRRHHPSRRRYGSSSRSTPTAPRNIARGRARPRRAALGARVVEQPVRHQPAAERHLSGRRAVQPVLRLRPVEDGGGAGGLRGDRARARRHHRAAHRGSTGRFSRRARRRSSGWCAPASSRSSATASSGGRWCTSTTSSTAWSQPS